jgi:hypothetical protein
MMNLSTRSLRLFGLIPITVCAVSCATRWRVAGIAKFADRCAGGRGGGSPRVR